MAAATHIKQITTEAGKTKYQAQVWHKGVFYASKTFDLRPLAVAFKEDTLKKVVSGAFPSAAARRANSIASASLDEKMTHWAELYVAALGAKIGRSRSSEYILVGRLLADKSLRDFDGKAGAQIIASLAREWRHDRQARCKTPIADDAPLPAPLAENTVRLRSTALTRLIRFAKSQLPEGALFRPPAMDELFEFALPPAYAAPRSRQPSDDEYRSLLRHIGADSELGHFLRAIDETGCRLSELRLATGNDVRFFSIGGNLVGGSLTREKHKTSKKVGVREVPLSLFAAQILHQRKKDCGAGNLFAGLGTTDSVCKTFDAACQALCIDDLSIKDFRRAFINRNKYSVAHIDLLNIVGHSSLIDKKNVTAPERAVQAAVGHADINTTAGYARTQPEQLARIFTKTSRWPRVSASPEEPRGPDADALAESKEALQRLLAQTLEDLASVGVTVGTR